MKDKENNFFHRHKTGIESLIWLVVVFLVGTVALNLLVFKKVFVPVSPFRVLGLLGGLYMKAKSLEAKAKVVLYMASFLFPLFMYLVFYVVFLEKRLRLHYNKETKKNEEKRKHLKGSAHWGSEKEIDYFGYLFPFKESSLPPLIFGQSEDAVLSAPTPDNIITKQKGKYLIGAECGKREGKSPVSNHTLIMGSSGCHEKGALIPLKNGEVKKVEDIISGDVLIGEKGEGVKVLSLHRGRDKMYRITPNHGDSFVVNGGHILHLKKTHSDARLPLYQDISVNNYLSLPRYLKKNYPYSLYKGSIDTYSSSSSPLSVPPYILGILLGDGLLRDYSGSKRVGLCNPDGVILKEFSSWIRSLGGEVRVDVSGGGCTTLWAYSHEKNNPRLWLKELEELHLLGTKAENKFIPLSYKRSNREDRLSLLAGLLDTDGSLERECAYDYITKSKRLAEDIKEVCFSLGLYCKVLKTTKRIKKDTYKKGYSFSSEYYRLYISGNLSVIPNRLKRKHSSSAKEPTFKIRKIEYVGEGDYYGFEVEKSLYLYNDYNIFHNSGKGVSTIIPTLLSYPDSVICYDPAEENYGYTSSYRSTLGKVLHFNPQDESSTLHFNPLEWIRRDNKFILTDIENMTQILIKSTDPKAKFFDDSARDLCKVFIEYVLCFYSKDKQTLFSVATLTSVSGEEGLFTYSSLSKKKSNLLFLLKNLKKEGDDRRETEEHIRMQLDIISSEMEKEKEKKEERERLIKEAMKTPIPFENRKPTKAEATVQVRREHRELFEGESDSSGGLQAFIDKLFFDFQKEKELLYRCPENEWKYTILDNGYNTLCTLRSLGAMKSEQTMGSITQTLNSNLLFFTNNTVASLMDYSSFDAEDLTMKEKPLSIYLSISNDDTERCKTFVELFFTLITRSLSSGSLRGRDGKVYSSYADKYKEEGRHTCLFLIDEFPQLGRMKTIEMGIPFMRKFGVVYMLITQDLNQLSKQDAYGKEGASSIINNMKIVNIKKVGQDKETQEWVSGRLGNETVLLSSTSSSSPLSGDGKGMSNSVSLKEEQRPLMTPTEVTEMDNGEQILLVPSMPPCKFKKIQWYLDPIFKRRANIPTNFDNFLVDKAYYESKNALSSLPEYSCILFSNVVSLEVPLGEEEESSEDDSNRKEDTESPTPVNSTTGRSYGANNIPMARRRPKGEGSSSGGLMEGSDPLRVGREEKIFDKIDPLSILLKGGTTKLRESTHTEEDIPTEESSTEEGESEEDVYDPFASYPKEPSSDNEGNDEE